MSILHEGGGSNLPLTALPLLLICIFFVVIFTKNPRFVFLHQNNLIIFSFSYFKTITYLRYVGDIPTGYSQDSFLLHCFSATWGTVKPRDKSLFGGNASSGIFAKWSRIVSLASPNLFATLSCGIPKRFIRNTLRSISIWIAALRPARYSFWRVGNIGVYCPPGQKTLWVGDLSWSTNGLSRTPGVRMVSPIGQAIGGFASSLQSAEDMATIKSTLGHVGKGLAFAFDTTFLGLVSLVVMFPMNVMHRAEQSLISMIADYYTQHMGRRFQTERWWVRCRLTHHPRIKALLFSKKLLTDFL